MSLQQTPHANRLHIGIFGKVNSGKSTLLNALTGQHIAIVSDVEGTTTDPIYKAMEIHGIGPVVFIDTAGFADRSGLGQKRLEKTKLAAKKTDIAIVVFADTEVEEGLAWVAYFKEQHTPTLLVVNDMGDNGTKHITSLLKANTEQVFVLDAKAIQGVEKLREALIRCLPEDYAVESITQGLAKEDDLVLLVMPQDIQAPRGRLILPQVQTIRDLLDKKCTVVSCTTDKFEQALSRFVSPPTLIICDSQVFKTVYEKKPEASKLTSFSVLFANYKGDVETFIEGAKAISALTPKSKVLIAEACTHAPLEEDIGRVKIPRMLKQKVGEQLQVDLVSGTDFPETLEVYDLIIHCGACMFNRKYVLARMNQAKQAGVAITNYGVTIAYLHGILDKISV